MIQAIKTIYKGFAFRSRLEARWAVFFDAMGIKWEYEKEGYILEDKTLYLPDFWLPESKVFLEVKPECLSVEENKKCAQLAKLHPVILAVGIPEPHVYEMMGYAENIPGFYTVFDGDTTEETYTGNVSEYIFLFYHDDEPGNWESAPEDCSISHDGLEAACLKAKQARFEHGKNG